MSMSAEPFKATQRADAPSSAESVSVPVATDDPRIAAEQVHRLFDLGKSGSIVVFIALIMVWLPFIGSSSPLELLLPFGMLVTSQSAFNWLRGKYHADDAHDASPRYWGDRYAMICLLSGGVWGTAGVLWLPEAPFASQAVFGVVVAGLCLNTVMSRHVYPKAMVAYTAAAIVPCVIALLAGAGWEGQLMAVLSSLMWTALYSTTKRLHKFSIAAISLQMQNDELIASLAAAKGEAEKKESQGCGNSLFCGAQGRAIAPRLSLDGDPRNSVTPGQPFWPGAPAGSDRSR